MDSTEQGEGTNPTAELGNSYRVPVMQTARKTIAAEAKGLILVAPGAESHCRLSPHSWMAVVLFLAFNHGLQEMDVSALVQVRMSTTAGPNLAVRLRG
jgi:hypothetical protein